MVDLREAARKREMPDRTRKYCMRANPLRRLRALAVLALFAAPAAAQDRSLINACWSPAALVAAPGENLVHKGDRRFDGDRAEFMGAHRGEVAHEAAHRRAGGADNDDGVQRSHGVTLLL